MLTIFIERRELPRDEYPLLSRVLIGPNEKLGKIYLMERKMHREISYEVGSCSCCVCFILMFGSGQAEKTHPKTEEPIMELEFSVPEAN